MNANNSNQNIMESNSSNPLILNSSNLQNHNQSNFQSFQQSGVLYQPQQYQQHINQKPVLWNYDSGIQTKMPSSQANSCTSRDDETENICSLSQNSGIYETSSKNNNFQNNIIKDTEKYINQETNLNYIPIINNNKNANYRPDIMHNFKNNQLINSQNKNFDLGIDKKTPVDSYQNHNKNEMLSSKSETSNIYEQNFESAIPEIISLINDDDQVVVTKTVFMVYHLFENEKLRKKIESSHDLAKALIRLAIVSTDIETIKITAAVLYYFSLSRQGLMVMFVNGVLEALYKLLSSNIESIIYYSMTALHNLVLRLDGAKNAVRTKEGLRIIVNLLSRSNYKFLAFVTDCMQILAYGNQEVKELILQLEGPKELIRIINTYEYEKLLWTTTRVLKVLSVCPKNKEAIVKLGGMQALNKHLHHKSSRLVFNSLWTLRNLSDAATSQSNMGELLENLISLLKNDDVNLVTCTAGILANLTCNNQFNKQIVCQKNGIPFLLQTLIKANDRQEILEPTLCALRHLTARHKNAEYCQHYIRVNSGLPHIVKLLYPPFKWPVIKSCMSLVRNLAMCSENHAPLRKKNVIQRLYQLLSKAHQEIKRTCTTISDLTSCFAEGVRMHEIVEEALGSFQVLAKDSVNREIILTLDIIPLCIELVYYHFESIQKVSIGCLVELSKIHSGADRIELEDSNNILQSLLNSPNEVISSGSAQILSQINENKNKEVNKFLSVELDKNLFIEDDSNWQLNENHDLNFNLDFHDIQFNDAFQNLANMSSSNTVLTTLPNNDIENLQEFPTTDNIIEEMI